MANLTTTGVNTSSRDTIATWVILCSGIGLTVFAVAAAFLKPENIMTIFNSLLPLFGTWIGTVIAYYFSKENFSVAAKATQDLLGQMNQNLQKISVKDAFISLAKIDGCSFPDGKDESTVPLDTIRKKFNSTITRVPVFQGANKIKYVIHSSALFRYAYFVTLEGDKLENRNLKNMLDGPIKQDDLNPNGMKSLLELFAAIGPDATLADAKAKMDSIAGCQDLFVTENGEKSGAVLGWITNSIIAKWSKA